MKNTWKKISHRIENIRSGLYMSEKNTPTIFFYMSYQLCPLLKFLSFDYQMQKTLYRLAIKLIRHPINRQEQQWKKYKMRSGRVSESLEFMGRELERDGIGMEARPVCQRPVAHCTRQGVVVYLKLLAALVVGGRSTRPTPFALYKVGPMVLGLKKYVS